VDFNAACFMRSSNVIALVFGCWKPSVGVVVGGGNVRAGDAG
jgi:hypothetical protein